MALLGMHGYTNTPQPVTLIKEFYTLEHMSTTLSQMLEVYIFINGDNGNVHSGKHSYMSG